MHVTNGCSPRIDLYVSNEFNADPKNLMISAALGVFRIEVMKKYNLEEFDLSQGYLFFWDKFEKSNWFLECMIDLRGRDVTDGVEHISDGGQWDMFINLAERYGVVPKSMDGLIVTKLHDHAVTTRKTTAFGHSVDQLRQEKDKALKEIYNITAINLGEPLKKPFTWAFHNKDKKYRNIAIALRGARWLHCKMHLRCMTGRFSIAETVSIITDPHNKTMELYTVQCLGHTSGGRLIRYANAPVDGLKSLAIQKLRSSKPVWFGADMGNFKMNKAERLLHGDSLMTHAMVFTSVHLDENDKPIHWRVENSWGDMGGDKGCLATSDARFSELVCQFVLGKKIVHQKFLEVLERDVHVLLAYDPMGALA
ncbi:bleomycin hydrolase [Dissophora ornata]|nr:bleomycin hydrolase [Dissophora ornata]